MRVCLDANVLISYLLKPGSNLPPAQTVRSCLQPDIDLILGETTLEEVLTNTATKPYLASNISRVAVQEFLDVLREIAFISLEAEESPPAVSRDRYDDYLVALSIIEQVDYLVTGDKDLLVLNDVVDVRIVTPAMFMRILDATNPDYSSENGG